MSILKAAAVALAVMSATPASAASIYTLTFFGTGTGTSTSLSRMGELVTSSFSAATLTMSIVVADDATGGTANDGAFGWAASGVPTGISFFSQQLPGSFLPDDMTGRGLACFANPTSDLPVGTIAVDPSCGSFTFREAGGRSLGRFSSEFAGTVTGLTVARGGSGSGIDFAISAIPEPTTWALMLAGFGMVGYAMRRRRPQIVYA